MKYTWKMFDEDTKRIVNRLGNRKFTGVYGIPRGGMCLAVKLSHLLKIPLLLAKTKGCLIAEDIADTGETLFIHKDYFTAVLVHKHTTKTKPNVHGRMYFGNKWVVFPWEE